MWDKIQICDVINHKFKQKKIAVIGDLIVDEYILGKVSRISPEAPVPILNFTDKYLKAGGASNVASNISELGADVCVSGIVGDDEAGNWLRKELSVKGIDVTNILSEEGSTSIKTRFATRGQQLLRVDNEKVRKLSIVRKSEIMKYLEEIITDIDAVILSDYNKGVLQDGKFVADIIAKCHARHILVAIDSKSKNIEYFANADFVKPNNTELEEAVGVKILDETSLNRAGEIYLKKSGAKCLVVTRGSDGISVFRPQTERIDIASKAMSVYDVTGAGDTVISSLTLGLACGLSMELSVRLANLAASVVIGKNGTATLTANELVRRIYEEKDS